MSGLLRPRPLPVLACSVPRLRRGWRPLNLTHTAIGLFALALFALACAMVMAEST